MKTLEDLNLRLSDFEVNILHSIIDYNDFTASPVIRIESLVNGFEIDFTIKDFSLTDVIDSKYQFARKIEEKAILEFLNNNEVVRKYKLKRLKK